MQSGFSQRTALAPSPAPTSEPRHLRPVPTRRHVAPSTGGVLRGVLEDARAARGGAAADPRELAEDQGIGSGFDDRHQEAGERIADGDKASSVGTVVARLDAAGPGAAAQHAIDLGKGRGADDSGALTALGEGAERIANPARVDERRGGARRLLHGAPPKAGGALRVQHRGDLEPIDVGVEVDQRIDSSAPYDVLGVHEVEPETLADEDECNGRRLG